MMQIIKLIMTAQIKRDFSVQLSYIPTDLNTVADELSRGNTGVVSRGKSRSIQLNPILPTEITALTETGSDAYETEEKNY